jgi:hypothetical protein
MLVYDLRNFALQTLHFKNFLIIEVTRYIRNCLLDFYKYDYLAFPAMLTPTASFKKRKISTM